MTIQLFDITESAMELIDLIAPSLSIAGGPDVGLGATHTLWIFLKIRRKHFAFAFIWLTTME